MASTRSRMAAFRSASVKKVRCAQRRQNPALRDLDTDLDFGFVGRRRDARGNHHGAIVAGELGVGAVDLRLVAAAPS